MPFNFSHAAAQKIKAIMADKGGGLALRIHIRKGMGGEKWAMALEARTEPVAVVDGIPVVTDEATDTALDGIIIDWVQTPEGAGFGIFDRNLRDRNMK